MQTPALNGELDFNCKKVFKIQIKHKTGLPILPMKENTSGALPVIAPWAPLTQAVNPATRMDLLYQAKLGELPLHSNLVHQTGRWSLQTQVA